MKHLLLLLFLPSVALAELRIAVIDTGFDREAVSQVNVCTSKDATDTSLYSATYHGTNVLGIINDQIKDKSKVCYILIKAIHGFHDHKGQFHTLKHNTTGALRFAKKMKASIINMSLSGPGPDKYEKKAIMDLIDDHVTLVISAGNDGIDFDKIQLTDEDKKLPEKELKEKVAKLKKEACFIYPACYDDRIIVVGSKREDSNRGEVVDIYEDGTDKVGFGIKLTGTSQSTAVLTGKLVQALIEYNESRK